LVGIALEGYETSLSNKFDINNGEDSFDLASDEDVTGQIFATILPYLMMIFLFSGCMAVAPESIAGEKERGTISTLLVTPIKRNELAIGKIISLSVIALLSGLSSFLGTMLSLPKLMGSSIDVNTAVYKIGDYFALLGIILTTVLLLISLIAIISAFAKTVKEAGTLIMPLMLIVMLTGVSSMFSKSASTNLAVYFIPIYNSVQSMNGIFSFSTNSIGLAITLVINIVYSVLLAYVLSKMFESEKIMFKK
jgi:sodium transport system permease protein